MKILLTGITGNLGFEIAHSFANREVEILPVVRKKMALETLGLRFEHVIEADLTKEVSNIYSGKIDCIVHSAGNVHFEKSGDSNSRMMQSIIRLAKEHEVPIYYVSTAFLWRKPGSIEGLRNTYEIDKHNSEKILTDSGVPHTIFRPSVLIGNSLSGKLINWTGYYLLVAKFLEAAKVASNTKVRFPILNGTSNMIPVDQAAEVISETITDNTLGKLVYVTNPKPPDTSWVLNATLEFFRMRSKFELIDLDFADYGKVERTHEEEILYLAGKHFSPYWSLDYNFPPSAIAENLVTEAYLKNTLGAFENANSKIV